MCVSWGGVGVRDNVLVVALEVTVKGTSYHTEASEGHTRRKEREEVLNHGSSGNHSISLNKLTGMGEKRLRD